MLEAQRGFECLRQRHQAFPHDDRVVPEVGGGGASDEACQHAEFSGTVRLRHYFLDALLVDDFYGVVAQYLNGIRCIGGQ